MEGKRTQVGEILEIVTFLKDNVAMQKDMDEKFDVVNQRFTIMDIRLDGMDKRFDGVDERFNGVDERFDCVDKRFDGVDERFGRVDKRFDGVYEVIETIGQRFDSVDQVLAKHGTILAEHSTKLIGIDQRFNVLTNEMRQGFSSVRSEVGEVKDELKGTNQRLDRLEVRTREDSDAMTMNFCELEERTSCLEANQQRFELKVFRD